MGSSASTHGRLVHGGRDHGEAALLTARQVAGVGLLEVAEPDEGQEAAGAGQRLGLDHARAPGRWSAPRRARCAATIVELAHCGTQARVPGEVEGAPARAGRASPSTAPGRGGRRTRRPAGRAARRGRARGSTCPLPLGPTRACTCPARAWNHWSSTATVVRVEPSSTPHAAARPGPRPRRRPAGGRRVVPGPKVPGGHAARARGRGRRAPRCPGPPAARRGRRAPRAGSPSATTRPASSRTTSRSAKSTHGPEPVLDDHRGELPGRRHLADAPRAPTRRWRRRASRWARRAAGGWAGGRARRRARAAAARRRRGRASGCRPAGRGGPRRARRGRAPGIRSGRDSRCSRGRRPRRGRSSPRRRRRRAPGGPARPDPAASPGSAPSTQHRAPALAGVGDLEHPGEGPQEGRLARAARPDEQDPLAGRDVEVDAGDDRVAAAERPPRQSPDLDVPGAAAGARPGPVGSVTGGACVTSDLASLTRLLAGGEGTQRPGRGQRPGQQPAHRAPATTAPDDGEDPGVGELPAEGPVLGPGERTRRRASKRADRAPASTAATETEDAVAEQERRPARRRGPGGCRRRGRWRPTRCRGASRRGPRRPRTGGRRRAVGRRGRRRPRRGTTGPARSPAAAGSRTSRALSGPL